MASSLLFDYVLPEEQIAQRPAPGRASRLLHARCDSSRELALFDRQFSDLPSLLRQDDLLVLNNSRVIPCRFFAELSGGDPQVEVLLVEQETEDAKYWQALAKPMRRLKQGLRFQLSEHLLATVLGRASDSARIRLELEVVGSLELEVAGSSVSIEELIDVEGCMPIPPYIRDGRADATDREQYQTCFADERGSVAAPTAGLHFTDSVFEELNVRGVEHCFLTHHVGPASFLPVRDDDWRSHKMSAERFFVSRECFERIESARNNQRRVIAVGTTVVRALEGIWQHGASCVGQWQSTELFITPGYRFKVVNALVTNFHQPRSTHLLLVAAMLGTESTSEVYQHALAKSYRFLSYGDSMFLDL